MNPARFPEPIDRDEYFRRFVLPSADSVADLRRVDVYRVLDSAPPAEMNALANWIAGKRRDLAAEVAACEFEIDYERNPSR